MNNFLGRIRRALKLTGRHKSHVRAEKKNTSADEPETSTSPLQETATLSDLSIGRTQRAMLIFGLIILAAVIIVSLHIGEIGGFVQQIARTRLSWISIAILAQACAFLSLTLVWRLVLNHFDQKTSILDLFFLSVGKLFADQALPSAGISGALFIFHALTRRGARQDVAFTVFVFGAASFIVAFFLSVVASVIIVATREAPAVLTIEIAGLSLLVFLVLTVLLALGVSRFPFVHEWLVRIPFSKKFLELVRTAAKSVSAEKALFARCIALQLAARIFDALTLWLCFFAIAEHTRLDSAFIAVSIASLAATIAPTPMGVGSFEGGMVAALSSLGVPVETALTTTLLYRGLSLWLPLSVGFFIVQRELLLPRAASTKIAN